jgi:GntR family transcriptional regulator
LTTNDKPLYKQIEDYVLDSIDKGVYKEGQSIPTELEFCKIFNTSRSTVNKALNNLAYNGIIYRTAGRGSFVRMYSVDRQIKKLMGFTEQMQMLNIPSSINIIGYSRVKASRLPKVKEVFEVSDNDFIHKIERVRYVENDPIAVECIHISPKIIETIDIADIKGSLYKFIELKTSVKIGSSDFVISAIECPDEIRDMFPCEVNVPILKYDQVTYLMDGRKFEYNEIYYLSDKYQYKGSNFR